MHIVEVFHSQNQGDGPLSPPCVPLEPETSGTLSNLSHGSDTVTTWFLGTIKKLSTPWNCGPNFGVPPCLPFMCPNIFPDMILREVRHGVLFSVFRVEFTKMPACFDWFGFTPTSSQKLNKPFTGMALLASTALRSLYLLVMCLGNDAGNETRDWLPD